MFQFAKILVLLFVLHAIPAQPVRSKAPVAIPACNPDPYPQGQDGGC